MSKREFLLSLLALTGQSARGAKTGKFLQLTLYDRMPAILFPGYFAAIDRHYVPETRKARGLISYQRFHHYDLPEKVSLELWESEQAAKAWHDGEQAKRAWSRAVAAMPAGVPLEYRTAMHSMPHHHYILDEA